MISQDRVRLMHVPALFRKSGCDTRPFVWFSDKGQFGRMNLSGMPDNFKPKSGAAGLTGIKGAPKRPFGYGF